MKPARPRFPASGPGVIVWRGGLDLTVAAVEDGKQAARSIHEFLTSSANGKAETMADLRSTFAGIASPNPFWLPPRRRPTRPTTSSVPSRRAGRGRLENARRGWSADRECLRPRYGAIHAQDRRVIGFNNIELITDRPLQVNLQEIKQVKRDWKDRALVVSLMVPCTEDSWKNILAAVEETEADGVELNFGCPHGMSERGMGAAVGQVPEYIEMVTRWCKQHTRMPVIVKLTPNVAKHPAPGRGREKGRRGCRLAHQHGQLDDGRRH